MSDPSERKIKVIVTIAGVLLGVTGMSLIVINAGWQIALGVFIVMYANNLAYEFGKKAGKREGGV